MVQKNYGNTKNLELNTLVLNSHQNYAMDCYTIAQLYCNIVKLFFGNKTCRISTFEDAEERVV